MSVTTEAQNHLKVLVVDDDRSTRMLLKAFLMRAGHHILEAHNGREAIEAFVQYSPDLVLMDVNMPVMTGYEAAHAIKQQSADRFVPIIFLTGLHDDESLARCVESGGDDFLVKPFNSILLGAKITAMQRIRKLYQELAHYRQQTEQEIALTHHVFDSLTKRAGHQKIDGLSHWMRSAGHFSGDLLIHTVSPSGKLYLVLADFTGHGFSAAIGAVPVTDVCFAMARQDFDMRQILKELNRKLHELMPTGHFCAMAFVCADPHRRCAQVFNGGLPPLLLLGPDSKIKQRIASDNLALGILDERDFEPNIQTIQDIQEHTLVLHSDGLTEARNASGEIFGGQRLEQALETSHASKPLDGIRAAVEEFMGACDPEDDISLVTLKF
ncbi:MAG: fused response regulator/phosphatase [Methylophilaceae bacterium]|nr:fused response regulator/phosphatase [Methylophilaceae bacterium]